MGTSQHRTSIFFCGEKQCILTTNKKTSLIFTRIYFCSPTSQAGSVVDCSQQKKPLNLEFLEQIMLEIMLILGLNDFPSLIKSCAFGSVGDVFSHGCFGKKTHVREQI